MDCKTRLFTLVFMHFYVALQASLTKLKDVLFLGNPMYDNLSKAEIRIEVLKRLPSVTKIDGELVKPDERETACGDGVGDE